MPRKMALVLLAITSASTPAFSNCNPAETASVQKVFEGLTAQLMNGANMVAALGAVQTQLTALTLSPACRQTVYQTLSAATRTPPAPYKAPAPGPANGLPGCVGGVCSTPDDYFKAIR